MTIYYTNHLRGDGFGANYQTLIYAILYAEVYCKGEFIYTKPNLKAIYEDDSDEYEEIMNLSKCFKSISDIDNKYDVTVIDIMLSYSTINSNLNMYLNSDSMKKIRFMFKENKVINILDNNYNHIAIHIRRPSLHKNIDNIEEHKEGWDKRTMNIEQLANFTPRFKTDDYYINIINYIRDSCDLKTNIFHIFSEGKIEDFGNFKGDDIVFHLNEPVKDTYIYMVMSDILVISPSAFSYSAVLLNENTVFNMDMYMPYA
jgi:hypothetical protein